VAGNAPVPILTAPNWINLIVSINGICLAQGLGGANAGANRLWVAPFP
jgi:hypothetical protein